MEWLYIVLDFFASLEWWQLAAGFILTIIVALLLGIIISYLIISSGLKRKISFFLFLSLLFGKRYKTISPERLARQSGPVPHPKTIIKELSRLNIGEALNIMDLIAECADNLIMAEDFSGGDLLTLQTEVWDGHRFETLKLPDHLREEMELVYTDIHLLNNIAWLSKKLGRQSSISNDTYRRLLIKIIERLNRIENMVQESESQV